MPCYQCGVGSALLMAGLSSCHWELKSQLCFFTLCPHKVEPIGQMEILIHLKVAMNVGRNL